MAPFPQGSMGRSTFTIWVLLLGWLWLQPALAQHPLEADLPDHSHACPACVLHLDGKLALTSTPFVPSASPFIVLAVGLSLPTVPSRILGHSRIRAPPSLHCFFM